MSQLARPLCEAPTRSAPLTDVGGASARAIAEPGTPGSDLIRYSAMCSAIAECHRVDEVKDIRDKARALEVYAKQAMNVEAERKATEVRLRAERRTGELLREMKRATPQTARTIGEAAKIVSHDVTRSEESTAKPTTQYATALESTGISRQQAHRFEQLAAVPKVTFERHLQDPETKPTASGIVRAMDSVRAMNGAARMDDDSLWIWGHLREFERHGRLRRRPNDLFGGMTDTMQADVRRILPIVLAWLNELQEVAR